MVGLAFLGVFDRRAGEAAGHREAAPDSVRMFVQSPVPAVDSPGAAETLSVDARVLGEWFERTSEHIAAKEQAGESLQRMMDLTILQLLDVLRQAQESAHGNRTAADRSASPATAPNKPNTSGSERDIEDM
jgi:hypothetical protein